MSYGAPDGRSDLAEVFHPLGAQLLCDRSYAQTDEDFPYLLFDIDPEPIEETLTALGGIPLGVQDFRSLGLPQSIQEHVRVKQRQRGYDEVTFVESLVILHAAGGEWGEEFERLRQDPGLAEMIVHGLPSPRAALEFLQAFHQERSYKVQRVPAQAAREGYTLMFTASSETLQDRSAGT